MCSRVNGGRGCNLMHSVWRSHTHETSTMHAHTPAAYIKCAYTAMAVHCMSRSPTSTWCRLGSSGNRGHWQRRHGLTLPPSPGWTRGWTRGRNLALVRNPRSRTGERHRAQCSLPIWIGSRWVHVFCTGKSVIMPQYLNVIYSNLMPANLIWY